MNYQQLLKKIKKYVLRIFEEKGAPELPYHNRQHTAAVVQAAEKIAGHYQLSEEDRFLLLTAAWFHDTGYLKQTEGHEEESVKQAEAFLKDMDVPPEIIQQVAACIMATRLPQTANTLPEQILCDADLYHLGTADFLANNKLLWKEYNLLHESAISKLEWQKNTLEFLKAQEYFTDYGRRKLGQEQLKNITLLEGKIAKAENKAKSEETVLIGEVESSLANGHAEKHKDKTSIKERPDKGIETMFRVSSSNHQRLSDMADQKAHIMITVNSIILSAIISLVLRKLDVYGYLMVPTFTLLGISLAAMIFSILSTRPSIPHGRFTHEQVAEKEVNLLFFGNFYKMPLADFNEGMQQMMRDGDFLYGSLIRDVYAQGVVLGKKYHLLRIAYNIFMYGLIISVLAFIVAFLFYNNHTAAALPVPPTAGAK